MDLTANGRNERQDHPMKLINGSMNAAALPRERQGESRLQPDPATDRYLMLAETHYAARRRRERFLGADLLGEPAWDILLDLYIASKRGATVSTSSACLGAHVPATTALRWLQVLQDRGMIERYGDSRDQRRTLVRLSLAGVAVLERYFEANWTAFEGDEMINRWNAVASHGAPPALPTGRLQP